ncbi:nucleoside triphosphate pyrophosphohydrolase [Candidatus Magnetominusculus dajiuhuensis]|uniref:nucleoside triphosphate pyrophosphohydrolase n=1 Tax=Candidatus Magnetominusculus dajiuhuensis TaxID=3137712 RepID=UPI003B436F71
MKRQPSGFTGLVGIMDALRSERGCPWDKEQSAHTLIAYLIEETHELIEAVEEENPDKIREELGDVLFQLLFLARIEKEKGTFDIYDVIAGISDKMVTRHPHVFGEGVCETAAEVLKQWDAIKKSEGRHEESSLSGVPKTLPSLLRAFMITDRASRAGFDWRETVGVLSKLDEELTEFKEAVSLNDPAKIEDELGDILFTIVNIARFVQVNPEDALRKTINRFIGRFQHMEQSAKNLNNKPLSAMTAAEMDALWEAAKREGSYK